LPQVWLQQHLFHPGFTVRTHYHAGYWSGHVYHRAWWDHVSYPARWQWYDIVSAVVYGLHFPEPLLVGFAIWLYDRSLFHRYAAAFLTLAAMAFVVYIVYPAVPPWMAGSPAARYRPYHLIPDVVKIFNQFNDFVLQRFFGRGYTQVLHVAYNLTAAMPSLHAAFPVLSALYLRKAFGRWGWVMLGYAGVVWFSVVYMAEHWMIDVVVGLVFAVVAYLAVEWVARYWARRRVSDQPLPEDLLVGAAASRPHPGERQAQR
jgi:membrane-associated phospholipid phosphatase